MILLISELSFLFASLRKAHITSGVTLIIKTANDQLIYAVVLYARKKSILFFMFKLVVINETNVIACDVIFNTIQIDVC